MGTRLVREVGTSTKEQNVSQYEHHAVERRHEATTKLKMETRYGSYKSRILLIVSPPGTSLCSLVGDTANRKWPLALP